MCDGYEAEMYRRRAVRLERELRWITTQRNELIATADSIYTTDDRVEAEKGRKRIAELMAELAAERLNPPDQPDAKTVAILRQVLKETNWALTRVLRGRCADG